MNTPRITPEEATLLIAHIRGIQDDPNQGAGGNPAPLYMEAVIRAVNGEATPQDICEINNLSQTIGHSASHGLTDKHPDHPDDSMDALNLYRMHTAFAIYDRTWPTAKSVAES